ncbi:MAG: phosphoribosylformylglycinamidine synthase subunit PurS [Firmicutes bacterium]|nr:phosphoribosylformylglycinamidine synthase subunit PurS [Alicyclobacillaceae bacterium]MCL6497914.1 phosphoribosylformylglycinamidine synthase subunit PurS [Bacillota bacterium]
MNRYRVVVAIRLKPEVLDPAGQAVAGVLDQMGMTGVESVRLGRLVDLEVAADGPESARALAEAAARRLLANPVLETFEVAVEP